MIRTQKPGVSFRSDKKLYLPCKSKYGGLSRFLNGQTIIFLQWPQYCWIDPRVGTWVKYPPQPATKPNCHGNTVHQYMFNDNIYIYIYICIYIYVQIKIYNTLHHITSRGIALHCIFTLHT
jgi:hypothetical protein